MEKPLQQKLKESSAEVFIVGGGLAGAECAWQLARLGLRSLLIEQRPRQKTPAHKTENLAELVCSNSLKSTDPYSAPGLLKYELEKLDSIVLKCGVASKVPAGQALGVDREKFSSLVSEKILSEPLIEVIREEVVNYEELLVASEAGLRPVVLATGPLTSQKLSESLLNVIGKKLYFYDAIAPIVSGDSINKDRAFLQNRRHKGDEGKVDDSSTPGDYYNCPLDKDTYMNFIGSLKEAEKVESQSFEKIKYFQGCQPIEALLERGDKTLAFGPMKPVGIVDPKTGRSPYAVLQLRREDNEGRAWNMVGFQTKLKYPEQKRIFRMIPGLENAEFYRYGSLHRNTYIHSPLLLDQNFRLKKLPALHFAGQITGVEGYLESTAIGALVARFIALNLRGLSPAPAPSETTAIGALHQAVVNGRVKDFQPMNMNWGLVPLNGIPERDKEKRKKLVERAHRQMEHWLSLF